jgi:hypothetical protein
MAFRKIDYAQLFLGHYSSLLFALAKPERGFLWVGMGL